MRTPGSDRRLAIPAALTPIAVLFGLAAMLAASAWAARHLGLRPTLMVSEIALIAPGLMLALLMGVPAGDGLGLRRVDRRTLYLSLVAGLALWGTSLGVFETQYLFWRPPNGYLEAFRRLHEELRPASALDAILSVLAIAIAPAVCEELLFRGIVLPALLGPLGAVAATLASAALFGAIHLDFTPGPTGTPSLSLYRVPFAFVIGAALAVLRLGTGSLLPPIVAHALVNTITLAAAPFGDDPSGGLPDPRPLVGLSALVAGGAASALVLKRVSLR